MRACLCSVTNQTSYNRACSETTYPHNKTNRLLLHEGNIDVPIKRARTGEGAFSLAGVHARGVVTTAGQTVEDKLKDAQFMYPHTQPTASLTASRITPQCPPEEQVGHVRQELHIHLGQRL